MNRPTFGAIIENMDSTPQSLMVRLCAPAQPLGSPTDEVAWARFVDLYSPLLYNWSCRLGLQQADALDLVQEVFLLLHQKLPQFRYDRRRSFRSWLRAVFHNKWRDRLRVKAMPYTGDPTALAGISTDDPLEDFTEADYQRYLVRRAMELMQTDFEATTWQAFWETSVQGRSAADVAAQLNLSLAAVYKAASRVRQSLRQELDGLLE